MTFLIIDNDGINVGLIDCFAETYLEFDSLEDAREIAKHYKKWCGL